MSHARTLQRDTHTRARASAQQHSETFDDTARPSMLVSVRARSPLRIADLAVLGGSALLPPPRRLLPFLPLGRGAASAASTHSGGTGSDKRGGRAMSSAPAAGSSIRRSPPATVHDKDAVCSGCVTVEGEDTLVIVGL